jgi:succinate dehydrogenase / fumarate reductase iron-sulfur subunit
MASTVSKTDVAADAPPRGHGQVVKAGRLPVTEFAFDRAGAASPFGDDVRFPLPVEALTYVHPGPEADPTAAASSATHY